VIVSVMLPTPLRFYMWGVSLAGSLLLPFYNSWQARSNPGVRTQLDQAFQMSASAVERFGLFMIIVLGEVIAGVIRGLQGEVRP
jgi:low temperature requirement protein LtrA